MISESQRVTALLHTVINVLLVNSELFLSDEDVRKVHDFEEDCVDDYFNTLELQFESSTEERIKATNER